jgi:hypothetical protein
MVGLVSRCLQLLEAAVGMLCAFLAARLDLLLFPLGQVRVEDLARVSASRSAHWRGKGPLTSIARCKQRASTCSTVSICSTYRLTTELFTLANVQPLSEH